MAVFQPREILRALELHGVRYVLIGNLGGTLHGSPLVTSDADICPSRDRENLNALASALRAMGARIRTPDVADGLPFTCDQLALPTLRLLLEQIRTRDQSNE